MESFFSVYVFEITSTYVVLTHNAHTQFPLMKTKYLQHVDKIQATHITIEYKYLSFKLHFAKVLKIPFLCNKNPYHLTFKLKGEFLSSVTSDKNTQRCQILQNVNLLKTPGIQKNFIIDNTFDNFIRSTTAKCPCHLGLRIQE